MGEVGPRIDRRLRRPARRWPGSRASIAGRRRSRPSASAAWRFRLGMGGWPTAAFLVVHAVDDPASGIHHGAQDGGHIITMR